MIFVLLGLASSIMNVIDEFIWFTVKGYKYWKLSKDLLLLVGAVILVVGFFRFFVFSARLFGNKPAEKYEKLSQSE